MALVFPNLGYRYGFTVSKEATLTKTLEKVLDDTPFTACQFYISGKYRRPVKCDPTDILAAREILERHALYLIIHGCNCYNLAGKPNHRKDPTFHQELEKTCRALVSELDVGAGLGCGVIAHIGSCKDKEKGIETIAKAIENVLTRDTPGSKILAKRMKLDLGNFKKQRFLILENAAGEGSKIGATLEEIAQIIELLPEDLRSQVGVCIDTAHAFGAGIYDWGLVSEVKRFYSDFEKLIGLSYLKVFHLNDSRCSDKKGNNAPFGSRKDRHENLGLGYIFGDGIGDDIPGSRLEGLKEFFFQAYQHRIPIIGEPPRTDGVGGPGLGGRKDWPFVEDLLSSARPDLQLVRRYQVKSEK